MRCMLATSCRTDFGGAVITGADFTNALVDKSQQIVSIQISRISVDCISLAVQGTAGLPFRYALAAPLLLPETGS